MSIKKRNGNLCVYCGNAATTRDHVPPKGIFLEPRPHNLITVPACNECNGGFSEDDEKFRNYVSFAVSADNKFSATNEQRRLLDQSAMRGMRRSPKKAPAPAGLVNILTQEGKRQLLTGKISRDVIERVAARIVKAFYFHECRYIINLACEFEISLMDPFKSDVFGLMRQMPMKGGSIGGEEIFSYQFGIMIGNPDVSLWIFDFYRNLKIGVITGVNYLSNGAANP